MKRILSAAALAVLFGCSSVPKETAVAASLVTEHIGESRVSHLDTAEQLAAAEIARVMDRIRFKWAPEYVIDFLKEIDLDAQFCDKKGEMDRALVVIDMVEDITAAVQMEIMERIAPFEQARSERRRILESHYNQGERMSAKVTATIETAVKGDDMVRGVIESTSIGKKSLDALDGVRTKLEKAVSGIVE